MILIQLLIGFLYFQYVRLEEEGIWGFDDAPGIAMEYKIHIDAGKEDCYWQYVHHGATIYINMQVSYCILYRNSS